MTETAATDTLDTTQPASGVPARFRALIRHKEFGRFWKFAVVGTIGAAIDFGTFTALRALGWFRHVEIRMPIGQPLTEAGIAGAIALVLAVISNFLWNRYWTYPDSRSKRLLWQLFTFFAVNVVGVFIRVPIIENLSRPFSKLVNLVIPAFSPETALWFGENGAWALAVIVVMFWNFFVNRYWTYNDVE